MPFFQITSDVVPVIGNALYDLRAEKRKMNQGDVAKKMDKSQGQISLMEHNIKIPALRNLVSFLDAIDCKLWIEYEHAK
jgi:hypothetical protein